MREMPDAVPADATEAALERLSRLAAAGAPADRMVEAVGEIVAGWAGEADMDAGVAQTRIGAMWDSLTRDLADLEEAISDDGGDDGEEGGGVPPSLAGRVQAALRAATGALAAVAERMG